MSLRIAIAGTGLIADLHAQELKKIRGVEITSCCDISNTKARKFALRHQINVFYPNVNDMLDQRTTRCAHCCCPTLCTT